MRLIGKRTVFSMAALLGVVLLLSGLALAQPKGGAMMSEDVFTPIAKGFDEMRAGNYEAAKYQFADAVKRDPNNSFALNNLAVLEEREGKLKDAMANLKAATTNAAAYKDKVQQTCFVGGLCTGVKPIRAVADTSEIAPIIQENIKKLEAKMAQTPAAPQPSTPPPVSPKK
jgi:tetratricopeptide (TPR) repeat protein